MNPLAPFLAWLSRKRAARALVEAERRRQALMSQKAYRKAKHMPSRYLDGLIRQATTDSLQAALHANMIGRG